MRVVLLGTGAGPDVATRTSRCGASILVDTGKAPLMFDCGRRAVEQLADAGYALLGVDRLFFTHLHSGHTVCYPDFVLSSWVGSFIAGHPARTDFKVYGPVGTKQMTDALFGTDGAFNIDLRAMADAVLARREFAIHAHRVSLEWPAVHVTEITHLIGPGAVVSTVDWHVHASFGTHGLSNLPCLAYRIDSDGRALVISGDTCPSDGLISMARRADVLIHEGGWTEEQLQQAAAKGRHTSAHGAGRVAREAGVRKLVLTSILQVNDNSGQLGRLLDEATETFDGEVVVAEDLMAFDV